MLKLTNNLGKIRTFSLIRTVIRFSQWSRNPRWTQGRWGRFKKWL